jgi:hypothetical protein
MRLRKGVSARVLLPLLGLLLWGCSDGGQPYQSPAETYRTYTQAVDDDQPERVWACFSSGYREHSWDNDLDKWLEEWPAQRPGRLHAVDSLQILQERIINHTLGFLQFDETTVPSGESPFFYFYHDPDGWKVTSHLDPLFRRALEKAVEEGEYPLPSAP